MMASRIGILILAFLSYAMLASGYFLHVSGLSGLGLAISHPPTDDHQDFDAPEQHNERLLQQVMPGLHEDEQDFKIPEHERDHGIGDDSADSLKPDANKRLLQQVVPETGLVPEDERDFKIPELERDHGIGDDSADSLKPDAKERLLQQVVPETGLVPEDERDFKIPEHERDHGIGDDSADSLKPDANERLLQQVVPETGLVPEDERDFKIPELERDHGIGDDSADSLKPDANERLLQQVVPETGLVEPGLPVQDPNSKPEQQADSGLVQEPKPTNEPVEEPANMPKQEPENRPVEEPANIPKQELQNQPVQEPVNKPMEGPGKGGLREMFYEQSCPDVEKIVNATIHKHFLKDPTYAAGFVRLFFHDCFVTGCDASILLDTTPTHEQVEKKAKHNGPLVRGYEVVDDIKAELEKACPGVVSCADILAFATRDSLVSSGVPAFNIAAGRRDARASLAVNVEGNLPLPDATAEDNIRLFEKKGMTLEDLILLVGAHSIGTAHCSIVAGRFRDKEKEKNIDKGYWIKMQTMTVCMSEIQDVPFDPYSHHKMDSRFYKELLTNRALIESDHNLARDPRGNSMMKKFVDDQAGWIAKFTNSMKKLGETEVLVGDQGEVRKQCRAVN